MGIVGSNDRLADLESVYREHNAFVWRTLHHFGLRGESVHDAVQEVFLVVHRRWSDFDGRASIRNWLYGIARRVASDQRKKQDRHHARLRLVDNPDEHGEHARTLERVTAAELVRRFVDALDDDKREVFVLAEVEGMTAPEIASTLGINLNTVYARLRAARLRFAAEVARYGAQIKREDAWTR